MSFMLFKQKFPQGYWPYTVVRITNEQCQNSVSYFNLTCKAMKQSIFNFHEQVYSYFYTVQIKSPTQ